jgi:hypothetical protein
MEHPVSGCDSGNARREIDDKFSAQNKTSIAAIDTESTAQLDGVNLADPSCQILSNGSVKDESSLLNADLFKSPDGNLVDDSPADSPLYDTQAADPFDCSWCNASVTTSQDHMLTADVGDSITLKSNSSSACLPSTTPADISDCSSASASAPVDVATVGYSKLRDFSAPSSLCSASPFESPTHALSASHRSEGIPVGDDSLYMRPDSLCLQRSVLQQRERQWLIAKKGSYSSLSECDSSRSGSMDALIEAATSTPLHTQGTVTVDGDMITFVADGINELIKRSRGGSF